ncbi:YihA family ribosome biogenesis GTP-binding protein [Phaeovibrio sulfidiphilus]|uniref:Probable GTP-binding protein EngB n=1 Tax=Phaeovibrio sulfidiphilus TaxID=1220600 RepID=A0A8J7CCT9_9PROT|nr:ribosome biogenesis GTP-binding protein YihA/YsxC [Phaeovibrio sulfidiphilus]MBE1236124.1 YihA family ribosome biogenesis GTP-binding protein [Phaeovibrio sulfidiphilus]
MTAGTPEIPEIDSASPEGEALEFGRWLFAQPCTFLMGAVSLEGLPNHDLSEIAFCGRSNVGKSSLVNALTGRKTLARTSNTPGRTQELNYFRLGPEAPDQPALMMVDLPGYGFAKAPKALVERWTRLVLSYLKGRPQLRRVCLLIDSRHGLKPTDIEVMSMLDTAAVNYQVILTKTDKPSATAVRACLEATQKTLAKHVAAYPEVLMTSSRDGDGVALLRARLAALTRE